MSESTPSLPPSLPPRSLFASLSWYVTTNRGKEGGRKREGERGPPASAAAAGRCSVSVPLPFAFYPSERASERAAAVSGCKLSRRIKLGAPATLSVRPSAAPNERTKVSCSLSFLCKKSLSLSPAITGKWLRPRSFMSVADSRG